MLKLVVKYPNLFLIVVFELSPVERVSNCYRESHPRVSGVLIAENVSHDHHATVADFGVPESFNPPVEVHLYVSVQESIDRSVVVIEAQVTVILCGVAQLSADISNLNAG